MFRYFICFVFSAPFSILAKTGVCIDKKSISYVIDRLFSTQNIRVDGREKDV